MHAVLKSVPAAILIAFGSWHISANAELISSVCQVNGIDACQNSSATVQPSSILTIRGYVFDPQAGERPVDVKGGYVLVRNEDTLTDYKLPIQAIEARPDVVGPSITGTLKTENYEVVKAGFVAQVFMASLPAGHYSVQEVKIGLKNAGLSKLDLASAEQRATFNIAAENSAFRLVKSDGSAVPLAMGKASSNSIPVTGYPALRDGSYSIEATLPAFGSEIKKTVSFAYKRPVVTVPVSLPLVEGFPGMSARISLMNPLNNRPLDAASQPVVVEQVQGNTVSIDGAEISEGKALTMARFANATGVYQINVKDADTTEGQQSLKLWVNTPDAPSIKVVTTRWDPSNKVQITKSVEKIAIKVEDLDVQAKLVGGSPETCQALRTMKTENIMGEYLGTDCAIKFTTMPEGMKSSPYYANALRGSVTNVGDNKVEYQVGVVYTNPATKKTEFYPSKSGASNINITGVEPTPIEMTFRNDKLVDEFYTNNQAMFPDKYFSLVDPAQARQLGIMGIKSGHRGVRTRVTYPGDELREAFTTVLESSVPMVMKTDTPWQEQKVVVESWYEKAPEYKITKVMDFVGIPLGPVVDLKSNFISHDKADTIVNGHMGIAKGQNLVFDPATMGAWQVSVANDKTGEIIGQPVAVKSDGTFSVNLGVLNAGTRYIVAQARLINANGQAANSMVASKMRSLITASGDKIEANLIVRSMSGKAPFVQTIATNFKDPKMQANVKAVSWETLSADGTWRPVLRKGSEDALQTGINYMATVEQPGEAQFRAVLINKYSGATYTTDPIKLTAFDLPTFKVAGPSVVQVKKPVTFTIDADQGFDAEYTWRVVTAGGYENVGSTVGKTFTFTPTEAKSFALEVVGRQAGAPDNPAANVKKSIGVRAVNPLTARASITGPMQLETGKSYQFKATINDVVSSNTGKDYTLKGYWVLPDGTRVDGTDLAFTARPDDKLLSFYTYVDGYPEETAVSTFAFSTWTYNWPTNWQIRLQPLFLDVPATVKFVVETPNFKLGDLRGEPLTYTWSLPQNITQTAGNDSAGTFTISKFGNYQVALQIADTRGNVVNVTSDEFTIMPPSTVETEISLVSKYGDNIYAPGSYYLSTKTLKLPRGDSFLRHEAMINGQKVGEYTGSGNYVTFNDAGSYDVTVRTVTKSGNYGEQSLKVNVQAAPAPVCDIKLTNTTAGVLVTPICTVDAGNVKSYTWTYMLDGQEKKTTSKTFLVAKQWIASSSIGTVSLEVEGFLGGKTTQEIIYK